MDNHVPTIPSIADQTVTTGSTDGVTGTLRRLLAIVLGVLTLALVALALLSLRWRMEHDPPIMLYFAMLIDRFHFVPYRDIYDINMPGAYLIYIVLGRITNNQDLGLRLIDLLILAGLSVLTWRILRPFGALVAWLACLVFGFAYLGAPNVFTLQREYLLLLPLAGVTMLLVRAANPDSPRRSLLIGLLLGLCGTVKPHTMLAAIPPIALFILAEFADYRAPESAGTASGALTPKTSNPASIDSTLAARSIARPQPFTSVLHSPALWRNLAALAVGVIFPLALMLAYLVQAGALTSFLDIVRNYWPLYGAMSGDYGTLTAGERPHYLLVNFVKFGGYRNILPFVVVALYLVLRHGVLSTPERRRVGLISGFALCYSLYTMLAAGFWTYHWLPFLYFAILLSSLAARRLNGQVPAIVGILACLLLCVKFARPAVFRNALSPQYRSPKHGRVDAIAAYLQAHARPGDTVQAMDYTGGANHAMLIAGLPSATPFIADFVFYHHISHPYVQRMRSTFLTQMAATQPRFVIQVLGEDKPWPHGPDTTRHFEALETLLNTRYRPALQRPDFIIWERNIPYISPSPPNPLLRNLPNKFIWERGLDGTNR